MTKELALEHSDMMVYSREVIELQKPKEMNGVFYTMVIFFILFFTGIFTIKINDVIKVPGIVRSLENNSEIRNVISGTITSKNYRSNQFVQKDQTLLTIDDKQYISQKAILSTELENAIHEKQYLDVLLEAIKSNEITLTDDEYIDAKVNDYFKNLNYLKRQVDLYSVQYTFEKEMPETLKNSKSLKEVYYQYKLKKDELEKFKTDTLAQAIEQQQKMTGKINSLNQEIIQLDSKNAHLVLKAPVSGYVQELSSLNIGDYIEEGHKILRIIPLENPEFKIELSVPTKDIGEITEGMQVKYRLSAFPFFEYKGAQGNIKTIDPDIRQDSNNKLIYCVYSDIDKISFKNNQGKEYPLRSGIEVDARIVLNKISIASYIFRKMGFMK